MRKTMCFPLIHKYSAKPLVRCDMNDINFVIEIWRIKMANSSCGRCEVCNLTACQHQLERCEDLR